MATAFSTFVPEVLSQVPFVPHPLAVTAVRFAATEFCRDAGVWVENLTPIDSVVDQDEYTLTSNDATNGLVRTIMAIRYNNVPLRQLHIDSLLHKYPDHPNTDASDTPHTWAMVDRDTITLFPVPGTLIVGAIKARVTVIPKKTATGLDANVAEDYEEQIIRGALERVLRMPDKAWTDLKTADFYGKRFRSDIALARIRMSKNFGDDSAQVAYPKVVPTSVSIRRAV